MPSKFLPNKKELLKVTFKNKRKIITIGNRNVSTNLPKIAYCNYVKLSSNICLFALKHPSQIYFHGILEVQCLFGEVDIFGYILKENESKIVYSLLDSSALYIQTVGNHGSSKPSKSNINKFMKSQKDLIKIKKLLKVVENDGCLFTLKPLTNRSKHLEEIFTQNNIHFVPNLNKFGHTLSYFTNIEYFLNCIFDYNVGKRVQKKLVVDNEWNNFIDLLTSSNDNRLMICGGKGFGKTTILRYLINKVLNILPKIVLIDLDAGQPVMNMPNQVSCHVVAQPLLGPNFTQLQQPKWSLFIPDVNVEECVMQYLNAMHRLAQICIEDDHLNGIPWIINTMGFSRGVGVLLQTASVKLFKPTNLLLLKSNLPKFKLKNFRENLIENEVFKNICNFEYFQIEDFPCNVIETVAPVDLFHQTFDQSDKITSKQLREAIEIVYFGECCRHYTLKLENENFRDWKNLKEELIVALCNSEICKGFGKLVKISGSLITIKTPIDLLEMFENSYIILYILEMKTLKFKSIFYNPRINSAKQINIKRKLWHKSMEFRNKRLCTTYKLLNVKLHC